MRKIVLYIAMSLDGYIASSNGSVSWLNGDNSNPQATGTYPEFIETIDTIIMGHTTYHKIITELSPNKWASQGKYTYVLTHQEYEDTDEIKFINIPIEELLKNLKNVQGKSIWICGGANVINPALEAYLVDEITISVIPIILGNGIPLFETSDMQQKLKLISTKNYNGIVDLKYQAKKHK